MLNDDQILVRDRLIEGAFVELRQHMGRLRPSQPSTFWPDFGLTRQELRETLISRARDGLNTREAFTRPDPPSAQQISRADECSLWRCFVEQDGLRHRLMARIQCYATRRSWSHHCRRHGWVKRTTERQVDKAIQQIGARLSQDSVFIRLPDEDILARLIDERGARNRRAAANAA